MSDTPLMDSALAGYKLDPARWKELRPMPRKLYRRGREIEIRMNKAERRVAELERIIEDADHEDGGVAVYAYSASEYRIMGPPRRRIAILSERLQPLQIRRKRQEGAHADTA